MTDIDLTKEKEINISFTPNIIGSTAIDIEHLETKTDAQSKLAEAKQYTDDQVTSLETKTDAQSKLAEAKQYTDDQVTSLETKTDAQSKLAEAKQYTDDQVTSLETKTDAANKLTESKTYTDNEINKINELIANYHLFYYGVEFDTNSSSPNCTRVGNINLHRELPIQNKMRGCLLDDEGQVVKYLNHDEWGNESLDGSMGQVMIEMPAHFRKFEYIDTKVRVLLSEIPLVGFHYVPLSYCSAYEATVDRTDTSNIKLASVKNTTEFFRGGNNTSSWDNTYRSLLGLPATSLSRTDFRNYARNRNTQNTRWNEYLYDIHKTLYWLFVVEYATLNSQANYTPELTSDGMKQGGLGVGVTNLDDSLWSAYNSYNPFIPCGYTDSLGNKTGVVEFTMPTEYSETTTVVQVPRYRGVENPFGHIWKWSDGINVRISANVANGGDGLSKVYTCNNPDFFSDSSYEGYNYVGDEARNNGYVTAIILGEHGDVIPISIGGGSSIYYCDYHYTNIPSNGEALRGVLFGGAANHGSHAGFVYSYSHNVPSTASAVIGSRLCFL